MPTRENVSLLLAALALAGAPRLASAQPEPRGSLPAGHPPVANDDGADDPSGDATGQPEGQHNPGMPGQRVPANTSIVDPALPAGTIVVEVRDKDEQPIAGADVMLGILQNSVAKGESRSRRMGHGDATGAVRFDGLTGGSAIAYRVSIAWSGAVGAQPGDASAHASYAAIPFNLEPNAGQRVRLHVYPTTSKIDDALVAMQSVVYIELKDDVLQFEEMLSVYNFGSVTWVPNDLVFELPKGWKALTSQQQMSDVGVDSVEGRGARLRGTFAPGQHDIEMRFQVPYDGSSRVDLVQALPPHVASARVIAEAARDMVLEVPGFPAAALQQNGRGQRVLITERQMKPGEAASDLRITLDHLPGPGPGRWIASGISVALVLGGLFIARGKTGRRIAAAENETELERARERLLDELARLERAHTAGEVGPKTYERARRLLLDSLARVLPADARA